MEFCFRVYKVTPKKRNFIDYKFDLKRQKILKPFIKGFQNVAKPFMVLVFDSHKFNISHWYTALLYCDWLFRPSLPNLRYRAAWHTVWPQPISKKVRSWWQIPLQHQSTYLGGPESASIEIPPFRLHIIKFQKKFF